MDNVVSGTDTLLKAIEYYEKSHRYLQEAGKNLRQCTTNSVQLKPENRWGQDRSRYVILKPILCRFQLTNSLDTKHLPKITKGSAMRIASKTFALLNPLQ